MWFDSSGKFSGVIELNILFLFPTGCLIVGGGEELDILHNLAQENKTFKHLFISQRISDKL